MIAGRDRLAKLPRGRPSLSGRSVMLLAAAMRDVHVPTINKSNLVFLDVETTGLSPAVGDRIVEIALIACRGGRITARMSRLVNPGMPIPPEVQRIHGITDTHVANQPGFSEIASKVARLIDGAWLIGHCVRFDVGFLAMELALAGQKVRLAGCLDTCQLARAAWDMPDYRLDTLAEHLGLRSGPSHRAGSDAAVTRRVFERVVRQLGESVSITQLRALHDYPPQWPVPEQSLPAYLYDALTAGQPIQISYVNGTGGPSVRTIRPVACFACGSWTYLRAHCQQAGELRTFRLDRIMAAPNRKVEK